MPAVSQNPEIARHYAVGKALSGALQRDVDKAWAALHGDPDQYRTAVSALVTEYSKASISLNHEHYVALRDQAGVTSLAAVPVVTPADPVYIDTTIRWAMSPAAGTEDGIAVRTVGVAQKLVANSGRREMFTAMDSDRVNRWARVTSGSSCYFCRMLASRGAVYRSDTSADFDAHGHCNCSIEPVFASHYEPTAQTRSDQRLWADSTDGLHGQDAVNAFRRAIYAQTGV